MSKQKEILNNEGFNLRKFTFREFEVFLILLFYDGRGLNTLKNLIDNELNISSRTKSYDYIQSLCDKKIAEKHLNCPKCGATTKIEKKEVNENKKKEISCRKCGYPLNLRGPKYVFIEERVRNNYEKFFSPTFKDKKKAYKEFLKENLAEISSSEKYKNRLIKYTDKIIQEINTKIPVLKEEFLKNPKLKNDIYKAIQSVKREELLIVAYEIIPEK